MEPGVDKPPVRRRRKSIDHPPPYFAELRMVLLGKNCSEISRLGNLILGREAFHTEAPPPLVKQSSERARGIVQDTYITIISSPHLFTPQLSTDELNQRVRECMTLSSPGPHVLLLLLQTEDFTQTDRRRLDYILHSLSEEPHKHILVIRTEKLQSDCSVDPAEEKSSQSFITGFSNRYFQLNRESSSSDLVKRLKKINEENRGSFLKWKEYEDAPCAPEQQQHDITSTGDLTVVLVGKSGVGKSASGNTILGRKAFKELMSFQSVTTMCQKESADLRRGRVTVIDTPGLFDTHISKEQNIKEIAKCITMATPGPHVFLLVLTVGRFTQEEKDLVKMIQNLFGEESSKYTMVLFTRGDDLDQSIEEMISASDYSLQNLIYQCGHRYHVFNNRNPKNRSQVTDLLEKIDSMVAVNGGSCYTNEMFQNVEKALQEEQERILKEKNEELEREKEKLKAKHEAELEILKKIMEDKRKNLKKERREKEEEFKKREAPIKEETNKALKKELKVQREAFDKEMERKERAYKKQKHKDLQYQEQKYNREKESIRKQAEEEARQQAEEEFCAKLEKENKKRSWLYSVGGAVVGAAIAGPAGLIAGTAAGAAIGAAVKAISEAVRGAGAGGAHVLAVAADLIHMIEFKYTQRKF